MDLKIDYDKERGVVELDNGFQYINLSMEEVRLLRKELQRILRSSDIDKELEKDWNYLGGL